MKLCKSFISLIGISLVLAGCVSQKDFNQVKNEKKTTEEKLASLEKELELARKKIDDQAKELIQTNQITNENRELKEKLDLYRSEANPKNNNVNNYNTTVEDEYINNLLQVYDFKAVYMDSWLDGKVPGVVFKIKNKGKKTLSEIEVTVYFTDGKGNNIAEETYYPVLDSGVSDFKELKPNYTFQFDNDHFYSAKLVPKEWKSGNATIKITSIKFKEE
ncbi:hypothetical protein [Paenibacillus sp. DMB20]|uniref:hypothetical protein n=1 Tax=Paenibacillus sp. DMB20 TaxID=1642570 RepID=UPI0006280654|nr:hypothetical protein [Paenibacillus sp. DMB20]KKO53453.1 hypothetical protein XI25_12685 [Paenibacillus sp. DMB20]